MSIYRNWKRQREASSSYEWRERIEAIWIFDAFQMKIFFFFFFVFAFEAAIVFSIQQAFFPLGQRTNDLLTGDCSSPSAAAGLFSIHNNCIDVVWAASIPGGGKRMNPSEIWILDDGTITGTARIWARTNCVFNSSGTGLCQTGDCGGLLHCQTYGSPPNTIAEFAVNSFSNMDFFDISLVDGFNLPMEIKTSSSDCSQSVNCAANITEECPSELRAPGGCNSPCTVFKTDEYCCRSSNCSATNYSQFFKEKCPNTYSYALDNQNNTFSCSSGTSYEVIFCP